MGTFENVLFIGIGGGNDVFSTILAAWSLKEIGWKWKMCSFAGVLSPFHQHTLSETTFPGVWKPSPDSQRLVARNDGTKQIGFIDASVARMLTEVELCGSKSLYALSLEEGTRGLTQTFRTLAREYEYTVLVDVGGDCFYRGAEDTHVISPMFDATVIRAFVESNVPGTLFEAGPGTDGEIDPEALESILSEISDEQHPMQAATIDAWEALYLAWIAPKRTGNTVPRTIEAFRSHGEVIKRPYRVRAHIGSHKRYVTFEQRINTGLCRQFFLVAPKRISNPFAVEYSNPLEWFLQTQAAQQQTTCEANLEYVSTLSGRGQFLTPSPLFSELDRVELIMLGIQDLRAGVVDYAWLFDEDWQKVSTYVQPPLSINTASAPLVCIRPQT